MYTDSMKVPRAIIYQEVEGHGRIISNASLGLPKAQRNYPVHKLDRWALKWAIAKIFSVYDIFNVFNRQ